MIKNEWLSYIYTIVPSTYLLFFLFDHNQQFVILGILQEVQGFQATALLLQLRIQLNAVSRALLFFPICMSLLFELLNLFWEGWILFSDHSQLPCGLFDQFLELPTLFLQRVDRLASILCSGAPNISWHRCWGSIIFFKGLTSQRNQTLLLIEKLAVLLHYLPVHFADCESVYLLNFALPVAGL